MSGRLSCRPALGEPHLLGAQRRDGEAVRDGLTGGEPGGLASLQITVASDA
jgi:hypothetical protein